MTTSANRNSPRRAACLMVASLVVLVAAQSASADDGGVHAFLSSAFDGAAAAAPARSPVADLPAAQPRSWRPMRSRPLTVRLHNAPRSIRPTVVAARPPTKPQVVSIYEDRTLRRGDAVMTADGIRIFAGSASWPYVKADFVRIGEDKNLSQSTVEVLAGLNSLPRS